MTTPSDPSQALVPAVDRSMLHFEKKGGAGKSREILVRGEDKLLPLPSQNCNLTGKVLPLLL